MTYCINIYGDFKRLPEMQDSINRGLKKIWNAILSLKKEICNHMDGFQEYYTKWIKSDKKRQILYDFNSVWYLKTNKKTNKLVNITKRK